MRYISYQAFFIPTETSEREVYTEIHACISRHRNTLFRSTSESMVHTDKQSKSGSMEIQQPSKRHAISTCRHINVGREHINRSNICRQSEFCPRIASLYACAVHQSKLKFIVYRQCIFSTKIYGCTYHLGTSALITFIIQFIQSGKIVLQTMPMQKTAMQLYQFMPHPSSN